jgi:L-serine/L-threonine ammonia-lyase
MAHLCNILKHQGTQRLISSSGGNAGLAVATVSKQLDMQCEVVVPTITKQLVLDKLESLGAHVTVVGENWNEADKVARKRVQDDPTAAYISPYDNPLLWTGHSSLIDEVLEELDHIGALVVSVGGGGLLCGALEGLRRRHQDRTMMIAAETQGACSFGLAWKEGQLVRLEAITSVATSLGALEVTPVSLERAKEHVERGGQFTEAICTDEEAIQACLRFASDHRLLVEPACGAALAVVYSDRFHTLLSSVEGPIVIEVCGGSGVNLDLLLQWRSDLGL